MKKILLLFIIAMGFTTLVNAQDLTLTWDGSPLGDTVYVWGDPNDAEIVFHAVVHNNTTNGINVMVRRNQINMLDGTQSQFCWGLCFPPTTDESPDARFLAAGGQSEDEEFSGHYNPFGVVGTSVVEYMFYNKDNEDQNVKVVAKYWASPEGIAEEAMVGGSVSAIYPNPASEFVSLDYNLTSKVEVASVRVVNVLGAVVKEATLDFGSSKAKINVSDLENGIYFYSVLVNGDIYRTKKLVVQH